ncbi:hypothetical protein GH714_031869 [Hevea brasiliensis]|uniref:CSC1/OSCA1-like cytosolic domain-containing protein n=1 Tax=Hevea brasiliensis TaxID=3981 RepID=A0A6A6LEI0_HEVBR|nr:hypothetical protein GH714_031869 [Hevea brasiliensis]
MILSALLTSVGINLGLCFLFFTLYSILRKQTGNVFVYAPRLVDKQKSEQQGDDFNLERLLPSAGWVRRAWRLSEEDLLSISGLDALVFTRIFIFSVKVFTFGGIIGIFILLPVNYLGNQLSIDDFYDLPNKSLDSFSISNVNDGSNGDCGTGNWVLRCGDIWLPWLSTMFKGKRDDEVLKFSCSIKYQLSLMINSDAEKLYRRLARIKSENHSKQNFKRDGFLGLFGRKVNLLDHYEKKLEDLEDNVRMEQYSLAGEEVPAAFVSFKSRFGAAVALYIQQGINPTEWVTERAPEPQDVHWPFFSASFIRRWFYKLLAVVACIALTILFLIPVVVVQGLANLNQLGIWFPFLKGILSLLYKDIVYPHDYPMNNIEIGEIEDSLLSVTAYWYFTDLHLTIPLPVLTLLFNEYCRKRFLPTFKNYPTECLIKKDREDQNDPCMDEFYGKLVTAYRDPALMPVHYARNDDRHNSPLLHSEV